MKLILAKKIPLVLVTGFLGSGKTTFIKKLLSVYSGKNKIAVIQNEYASANIDTAELKSSGKKFEVLEINNGSVFCVCLLASFVESLASFIDSHNPGIVIVEASGLSDPIAIAEILQHEKLLPRVYLSRVWCVVDCQNHFKLSKMNTRIEHQLRIADHVILNKTDLAPGEIAGVSERVKKVNPSAVLHETSFCSIERKFYFDDVDTPVALERMEEHHGIEAAGRAEINTLVLKTSSRIALVSLKQFLHELETRLIRMKGYVWLEDGTFIKVQSAFGDTKINPAENYAGITEIIGLGYNINPAEFGRRFHDFRRGMAKPEQ